MLDDDFGRLDELDEFADYGDEYEDRNNKAEIVQRTIEFARKKLDSNLYFILTYSDYTKDIEILQHALKPYRTKEDFNLYRLGWRMQYTSSKTSAGVCSIEEHQKVTETNLSKNKNIYLSVDFAKYEKNWDGEQMQNTVHHEMAHAVVFELFYQGWLPALISFDPAHLATKGHGRVWEAVCNALEEKDGVKCEQYYTNAEFEDAFQNYKYDCFVCGHHEYGGDRNFADSCSVCGSAVIIEENLD